MDPLVIGLAVVVGLNLLMFPIAYKLQTDKLTDITYSISFASLAIYGYVAGGAGVNLGKMIIAGLILAWAIRLGAFLFYRVSKMGRDARFDEIRTNPLRFLRFFLMQGVASWIISLPFLFYLLYNAGGQGDSADISTVEWLGFAIALIGLIIEAVADQQKLNFKFSDGNSEELYTGGLYGFIQFPNYLGEILFWAGIFIASIPVLAGLKWLAIFSPIIIVVLLVFVSGIPPIIKSRKKKYGDDKEYQQYVGNTSRLIPGIY